MPEIEPMRDRFHALKTWPTFFDAVADGSKTFEVRKNDRGFRKDDILLLQRWDPVSETYTLDGSGHPLTIAKRITYVMTGPLLGIDAGVSVLGLAEVMSYRRKKETRGD